MTPPAAQPVVLLYRSSQEIMLRVTTVVCLAPVPGVAWLIARAPRAEWEKTPFGPNLWWLIPAGLMLLSLVLPAAVAWLHDRYALRLERTPDGRLMLVTFLLWGRRTRQLDPALLVGLDDLSQLRLPNGRRLIFDDEVRAEGSVRA